MLQAELGKRPAEEQVARVRDHAVDGPEARRYGLVEALAQFRDIHMAKPVVGECSEQVGNLVGRGQNGTHHRTVADGGSGLRKVVLGVGQIKKHGVEPGRAKSQRDV